MTTAMMTASAPLPNLPLERQILHLRGLAGQGNVTALGLRLPLWRSEAGEETLRLLVTDRCTLPVSWTRLPNGGAYSETADVDTKLPSFFFGHGNVLLDKTVTVTLPEGNSTVEVTADGADTFLPLMGRWKGDLYLTAVREGDRSGGMTHSGADLPAQISLTADAALYDEESFLSGLVLGLIGP